MRHLFIIDPLQTLNLAFDTSLKIMWCLAQRGDEVFACQASSLTLESPRRKVRAHVQRMKFGRRHNEVSLVDEGERATSSFSMVHMRKEPPYDMNYLETLWILKEAETLVVNDPVALATTNEKLVIADYPEASAPLMLSSDPQKLFNFATSLCNDDIIVKPLDLYGGRGIVRLHDRDTMLEDLKRETQEGQTRRLVQPFETKISEGEVRAFAVCGKATHWALKTPSKDQFLANTRAGSAITDYEPSDHEIAQVEEISRHLMSRGLWVAGFDIIQGKISEINITCPAVLTSDRESVDGFDRIVEGLDRIKSMVGR